MTVGAEAKLKRRRNKVMVMQAFTALKPILHGGQLSKPAITKSGPGNENDASANGARTRGPWMS